MRVNLLISTINEGILKIEDILLSPRSDLSYIVSHQYTDEKFRIIPPELNRPDVKVSQIPGRGVTRSRNNAIRHADADIALIADDDATYRSEYIDTVIDAFQNDESLVTGLFKIKTRAGEPEYKTYPADEAEIKVRRYAVSSLEIAFRVEKVRENGIFFDERFGAGQKNIVNTEESVFVDDCLMKGLKVVYFPKYVAEHPYVSSANSIAKYDKRRIWVEGAYDCRRNGAIAVPKAFLGTLRYLPDILSHGANPFTYFYYRLSAAIYILITDKNPESM